MGNIQLQTCVAEGFIERKSEFRACRLYILYFKFHTLVFIVIFTNIKKMKNSKN